MARCYRVFLGKGATYADQALKEGWVGTGWLEGINLEDRFKENWKEFNAEFVPIVMETNQIETKVAAGLACGISFGPRVIVTLIHLLHRSRVLPKSWPLFGLECC